MPAPADQISMAKVLTLLFEVTALFDMQTRLELVMLQKTMVVVEGRRAQARSAARHVGDGGAGGRRVDRREPWAARPDGGRAACGARSLRGSCLQAPERLAKLGRWLDRWSEDPAPREPARRALGGAALWWIAIALIWIAARLTFAG